jgi:redox-sensitive bicupin YhaK (pirin superfamily)
MIQVRKAAERGHFNHGWLDTYHTFSFADYQDPLHKGFRSLRVINEDRVQPGQGFDMHPHRDMEIVTYILSGSLEHKDSLGTGSVLRVGELQRMTAGTGILHSEFNPSQQEPVHLYQIWLFPREKGLPPSYEQKLFPREERDNRWQQVASGDGSGPELHIQQDTDIYLACLEPGRQLARQLHKNRRGWLQILRGMVVVEGISLEAGDGLALSATEILTVEGGTDSEIMFFDLN